MAEQAGATVATPQNYSGLARPEDFEDVMGIAGPTHGPSTISTLKNGDQAIGQWNIDDPAWADKWEKDPLSLFMDVPDQQIQTCEQSCADKARLRRLNCSKVRTRIAAALKKAGCPSKVTAPAVKKYTCATKKATTTKVATKKKTTTSRCDNGMCSL